MKCLNEGGNWSANIKKLKKRKEKKVNIFNAAGVSRRQVNFQKNVNILGFHDHICNHHKKCIPMSTDMPSSSSLIRGIHVTISET